MARIPTPEIDRIWGRTGTLDRWHRLWIAHLEAFYLQTCGLGHSEQQELTDYIRAADRHLQVPELWQADVDREEQATRHDLVAAMNVFNAQAGHHNIHRGLTSHDIVDVARQYQIIDSLEHLLARMGNLLGLLADAAEKHRDLKIVARTHGQPAQVTLYGHRIATILWPLGDWCARAKEVIRRTWIRPTGGAVGTGADLLRALTADVDTKDPIRLLWHYDLQVHTRSTAPVTRQVYHRSADLRVAGLLAELASIAATWATDRRLEALLELGGEDFGVTQVGSSAMPHKRNPVLCERVCSLAVTTTGHLATAAHAASLEWMEGDVSGSAARRSWLPEIFRTADQLLTTWDQAMLAWRLDFDRIQDELNAYNAQMWTGAALEWLVGAGVRRSHAHRLVAGNTPSYLQAPDLAHSLARAVSRDDRYKDKIDLAALEGAWREWSLCLGGAAAQVDDVVRRVRENLQ